MNAADKKAVRDKILKLRTLLEEQYKVSRDRRDDTLILELKSRIKRLTDWQKKPKPEVKAPVILKKKEFKEEFKKQFNVDQPKTAMVITSVEMLRQCWKAIMGQNISIMFPSDMPAETAAAIVQEAKKLQAEHSRKFRKTGGFR